MDCFPIHHNQKAFISADRIRRLQREQYVSEDPTRSVKEGRLKTGFAPNSRLPLPGQGGWGRVHGKRSILPER